MGISEVIALVSAALTVINKGIDYLESKKTNKEMTPEEETAYDAMVAERMKLPHWQRSKPKTSI